MRKILFSLYSLFALIVGASLFLGCKKSNENEHKCDSYGGVSDPNVYMFWIDYNPNSQVTVEVKDKDGKTANYYQTKIKQTASVAPQCNIGNYNNFATFYLDMGQTYTYTATSASKTWTGTITVDCVQNQCFDIQLK